MSINLRTKSLQFFSFVWIITLAIDHCNCDQGKDDEKDPLSGSDFFFACAIDSFISLSTALGYCSPLLIVVVGCSL